MNHPPPPASKKRGTPFWQVGALLVFCCCGVPVALSTQNYGEANFEAKKLSARSAMSQIAIAETKYYEEHQEFGGLEDLKAAGLVYGSITSEHLTDDYAIGSFVTGVRDDGGKSRHTYAVLAVPNPKASSRLPLFCLCDDGEVRQAPDSLSGKNIRSFEDMPPGEDPCSVRSLRRDPADPRPHTTEREVQLEQESAMEVVEFPDGPLRAVVLQAIGKPNGPITRGDLKALTSLDAESWGLQGNLKGIELCTSLRVLHLTGNNLTSLEPLRGLTELQELYAWGNSITSVEPLSGLTDLRRLHLDENNITSLEPLRGLTKLQDLFLTNNRITSLKPLEGLTGLGWLTLSGNRVTSLEPLRGLTNLRELSLKRNRVTSAEPLLGLPQLTVLHIDEDKVPAGQIRALRTAGVKVNGE